MLCPFCCSSTSCTSSSETADSTLVSIVFVICVSNRLPPRVDFLNLLLRLALEIGFFGVPSSSLLCFESPWVEPKILGSSVARKRRNEGMQVHMTPTLVSKTEYTPALRLSYRGFLEEAYRARDCRRIHETTIVLFKVSVSNNSIHYSTFRTANTYMLPTLKIESSKSFLSTLSFSFKSSGIGMIRIAVSRAIFTAAAQ